MARRLASSVRASFATPPLQPLLLRERSAVPSFPQGRLRHFASSAEARCVAFSLIRRQDAAARVCESFVGASYGPTSVNSAFER